MGNASIAVDPLVAVVLWSTLGYVVSGWLLAFRSGWLRRTRRTPDAPTTTDLLFKGAGWEGLRFAFSDEHRRLGDRLLSTLVWLNRILAAPPYLFFSWVAVAMLISVLAGR